MAPPPPPPDLPEDLIEAILLRLPPDEPAGLFRASLVCKPWRRLISAPSFRRRYRAFHRSPPMLGFLYGISHTFGVETSRFVPTSTSTSASCSPPLADLRQCRAIDAHHGRVLLRLRRRPGKVSSANVLVVWDPISDERRELPIPTRWRRHGAGWNWNAAVLCAADDHLDCHHRGGPFLVLFDSHSLNEMLVSTYSSDAGTWSDRVFPHQRPGSLSISSFPCAHAGNALYFSLGSPSIALNAKDGCLGCANLHGFKLYIWSMKDGPQVDAAGWAQSRVIDIEMLLQRNGILTSPTVAGFANGIGVVFLMANGVTFTVDLKTKNLKKVTNDKSIYNILPYMSFHTPALGTACMGEEPSAIGSDA